MHTLFANTAFYNHTQAAQVFCRLHSDEAFRINCFADYSDRLLSALCINLLYSGLERFYGLEENIRIYRFSGKPCLFAHPDIYFNLSHSGTLAACVLDNRPVGIDVQSIRQVDVVSLCRRFSVAEREYVLSKDSLMRFFRLWTMKEAYCKMTGEGLSGLSRAFVHIQDDAPVLYYDKYVFTVSIENGFAIAVCRSC